MVKEKNVDFNVIANHLTMGGFDTQPLMALTPTAFGHSTVPHHRIPWQLIRPAEI